MSGRPNQGRTGAVGVAVLAIVWRASPVGGFLAAKNSQMYSRRMASVITPLALLIGMTATILFVPTRSALAPPRDVVLEAFLRELCELRGCFCV